MKNLKIVIAGGTGFIGQSLCRYLAADNEIVVLTRCSKVPVNNSYRIQENLAGSLRNVRRVQWNGKDLDGWEKEINGADVVINLAGKSVNCRYSAKNKKEIIDSRVFATKAIGEAINKATFPPKLWINAASATIYRHAADRPQDEETGEMHNDFSVQVCKLWEKTFFDVRTPFIRKIAFRMAITLGNGGVMVPYLNLVKFGLGGRQGSGKQMFSWVHIADVCRAVDFVYEHKNMEGVYNLSAPNPVTNTQFMHTLRKAAGQSFGLPAYRWLLQLGAAMIGTETELILKSRWVVPAKLLQAGFAFKFSTLDLAMDDIIHHAS